MLVREVMTTPVVTVTPETSIKSAVELLAQHAITSMPVLDDAGELVGVVSEADVLLEAFLPDQRAHEIPVQVSAGPPRSRVAQVMSRHVLTIREDADLAEATELMVSTVAKSLPVVSGSRVVGMVSRRDLVHVLAERDGDIEAAVDELIRSAGYDWTTEVVDGVVSVSGPAERSDIAVAEVLVASVPGVVGVYFPAQTRRSGERLD